MESYLAVQSAWFSKFVMESVGAIQDCYSGRAWMPGEVVLVLNHPIELQVGMVKNKSDCL